MRAEKAPNASRSLSLTGAVVFGCIFFAFIASFPGSSLFASSYSQFLKTARPLLAGECRRLPRTRRYVPSSWEEDWYLTGQAVGVNDSLPCKIMHEQKGLVDAWLKGISAGPAAVEAGKLPQTIFSHYEFEDPCHPDRPFFSYIEPLVGHLRHPRAQHCSGENNQSAAHIESRDYLILGSGLRRDDFAKTYPGRKLLFDFGTSYYGTSLKWLVDKYADHDVTFDSIWAWELQSLDPRKYWADVPAAVKPTLHLYNVGITGNTSDAEHPIHIIKRYVQPGDFAVVKLDIDHVVIEMAFIEEIRNDRQLRSLIAEMMFEMHYSHKDMAPWFGWPNGTYPQVLDLFHSLRRMGLRLHYWP